MNKGALQDEIKATPADRSSTGTENRPRPISRWWGIAPWLVRAMYRVRVHGLEHLPASGGAVLLANRVSRLDPVLIAAACGRTIRFGSARDTLFESWTPRAGASVVEWAGALERGELVCLFGEPELSRLGQPLSFGEGADRALNEVDAPIIPVALEGASLGAVWRGDRPALLVTAGPRWRRPVSVRLGAPLRKHATLDDAYNAVQDLVTDSWFDRKRGMIPLQRAFVRTARLHPRRFAMADQRTPRLNFLSALARTIYLGRRLESRWGDATHIGILLPPSIAGALVNFAALLAGKIPVNLNYTASSETVTACLERCGIKTVISSKAFLEKVPLQLRASILHLEEVAAAPRMSERVASLLLALLVPVGVLERSLGRRTESRMDDPATVIFSSGSTGQPKGVVLSHFNVAANIAQMDRVFALTGRDCFLGTLPFFHSFGFTGTLCLTGTLGVGVAYHPTPLDPAAVSRLVRDYSITFLLSTPTFLQLYARGCSAEDFASLRVVMAGAEKLNERLASLFEEKFGIRPLEGYGCTECAPVVSVNTHDYHGSGAQQVGARRGTIGRPLPGISVRIVNPVTGEALPRDVPGLLLVRGPNVMQGYLHEPQKTGEVLREGWYHTGDIAAIEKDGFIKITDRLSRFSKIGGEMVPHIKVEERLHEIIQATEMTFVVASVPDSRKGERLVVLHRLVQEQLCGCLEQLAQDSMPNLWKPKRDDFIQVEGFPLLGTGKLDLRRIREIASEHAGKSS